MYIETKARLRSHLIDDYDYLRRQPEDFYNPLYWLHPRKKPTDDWLYDTSPEPLPDYVWYLEEQYLANLDPEERKIWVKSKIKRRLP